MRALLTSVAAGLLVASTSSALAQDTRQRAGPSPAAEESARDTIKQADALYETRDKKADAEKSLTMLRAAVKEHPDNAELQWRLARITFWLAEDPANKSRQRELTLEGQRAGEKAIALAPDSAPAHYFYAINLGEYSHAVGIVRALAEGLEGRFTGALDRVRQLDSRVDNGGLYTTLGRYWYELPWPRRSYENSISQLREGLEQFPKHLRMRVYLAESLIGRNKPGDHKEAEKLLQEVVDATPGAYDRADEKRAQEMARRAAREHNIKLS